MKPANTWTELKPPGAGLSLPRPSTCGRRMRLRLPRGFHLLTPVDIRLQ